MFPPNSGKWKRNGWVRVMDDHCEFLAQASKKKERSEREEAIIEEREKKLIERVNEKTTGRCKMGAEHCCVVVDRCQACEIGRAHV